MSISLGDEFRRVGPEVAFGEALLSYEDVLPLRNLVARDFVQATSTQQSGLTEHSMSTAGAMFFREIGDPDKLTPNRSVAAMVSNESMPEGWRLLAKVATFGRNAGVDSNKVAFYRIETFGEQVLQATKAIGYIRESTEIHIVGDNPQVRWTKDKKMFEKAMTIVDRDRLQSILFGAIKRAPYRTRDPAIDNIRWVPLDEAA